jgi:type I restriction enzyme R subunit
MVFYAGRIVSHKDMRNPTIVVLTDRNDLDDQLFGVFARCDEVIRQKPVRPRVGQSSGVTSNKFWRGYIYNSSQVLSYR